MQRQRHTLLAALAIAGLAVAGCGSEARESSEPTTAAATSAAPSTATSTVRKVASDVAYAIAAPEDWQEPKLDVYAPAGANGLPLVVIFHGNPTAIGKGALPYPAIARALAEHGAVVIAASWGPMKMAADGPAFLAAVERGRDETACAVSYAVSHAAEYGADPSKLVLIGHSGGATQIVPTVLGSPAPFPGCNATASWTAKGTVLWEGDFLLGESFWAQYQPESKVLAAFTPWGFLDSRYRGTIAFAVTDTSARSPEYRRCGDASWVAARDPSGAVEAGLEAINAFDDGCVDVREESAVTAAAMKAHGFDVSLVALTDPDSSHMGLGPADLARLSDLVISMATS